MKCLWSQYLRIVYKRLVFQPFYIAIFPKNYDVITS